MAPRALRHHQRKNIFIFANQENLRIFLICFFHGKSCFLCRERSRGTGLRAFIKFFSAGDAPLGQRQGGVFRVPPPCLWTPPTPQRERGCTPLSDPKAVGLHTKNPSRSAKGIFCVAPISRPLSRYATAPRRGASASRCSILATAPSREKANQEMTAVIPDLQI